MPKYTEDTFKDSKWTVFHAAAMGGKPTTPYHYIMIQAPRGVAEDVLRHGFDVNPNGVQCDHCGDDFNIHEDVENPSDFFGLSSNSSFFVCRADSIPYYLMGMWTQKWERIGI
jgi:hypothetical protein